MRLEVGSWSFILCVLLLFSIAQDSGARKIAITSGTEIQLKQLGPTDGLILTKIMQKEGAVVEIHDRHVNKDEEDHDDDKEDNHKKSKGKHVRKDGDHDHDDEDDHRKFKGKRVNKKYDDNKKIKQKHVHGYESSDVENQIEPELYVFFTPSDLKVGETMPLYFSHKDPLLASPKLLPKEEADQIPFSSKQLPSLLKFFSFPKHSPQAKAMKYTLKECEIEPMKGETKFCATSLESLLDFANYMFGSDTQFKVLTTTHLTNSTVLLQNYTISQVKEISVPKVIGCHPMPYPYAVFYCHSQESDTNLFEVLVEGQNGGRVQAAAVCHMDTSDWDPHHVSFRVLKVEPGSSPVCHFFPTDNLVWVPLPAALK